MDLALDMASEDFDAIYVNVTKLSAVNTVRLTAKKTVR